MTRRRTALALAVSALTVAPPALAARPVCNLVTDKAGDQAVGAPGTAALVSSDLDLRSADVSVDKRQVVAVFRLATLRPFDPRQPASRLYELRYALETDTGDVVTTVAAFLSPTEVKGWTYAPGGYEWATVAVDYDRKEVRVSAPLSQLKGTGITRGSELRDVRVETSQHAGMGLRKGQTGPLTHGGSAGGVDVKADEAAATRSYRAGTPTCVTMPR